MMMINNLKQAEASGDREKAMQIGMQLQALYS
jgi:hypothetical protein